MNLDWGKRDGGFNWVGGLEVRGGAGVSCCLINVLFWWEGDVCHQLLLLFLKLQRVRRHFVSSLELSRDDDLY